MIFYMAFPRCADSYRQRGRAIRCKSSLPKRRFGLSAAIANAATWPIALITKPGFRFAAVAFRVAGSGLGFCRVRMPFAQIQSAAVFGDGPGCSWQNKFPARW